jgi:hypothetical protein
MSDTTTENALQGAATEPAELPATETAPETGQEQPATQESTPAKPSQPDPRDQAIRQLAFEQRETRRQLQAAREQLERIQPRDPNAQPTPAEYDAQLEQRAAQLIERRETAAKQEAAIARGNAAFPDFTQRCNQIAEMGAADNPAFMATIWEVPEAHQVISDLAEHPAEAARILKLPPARMALELAKLSQAIATPAAAPAPVKATTAAPPPIKPLDTAPRGEVNPATMSSEQFKEYWNKTTRSGVRPGF